ncbi:hypothetical protein CEXT_398951 [Caerostris extrusa]|uniref:EGF-like domain-containing protein n=1 Tax=Caerostris extrusa TaxID=172846 RepID=A0AAV4N1Y2_CAEEX|nr:hypothetical protein CEXT_398951 [Caerostris extrusa]
MDVFYIEIYTMPEKECICKEGYKESRWEVLWSMLIESMPKWRNLQSEWTIFCDCESPFQGTNCEIEELQTLPSTRHLQRQRKLKLFQRLKRS